jgi:putative ABC transport system permease protein
MRLHDIAIESVRRRKSRFAFVLTAVALGVGTIVALIALSRTMQREVGDELDRFGANIVVTPKTDRYDLSYGVLTVGGLSVAEAELTSRDADAILTIHHRRNISVVSPKLVGAATIGDLRVLLVGTTVADEPGLKPWWHLDGDVPTSDSDVLIGSEAAAALGARPGSELAIGGERVRVTGVVAATGSIDDRAVFADLTTAQRLLGRPGAVSLIEVSALCRGCPIEDIVAQIAAAIPHATVTPIRQAVAAREQAVGQLTRFSYAIAALLLMVGTLVVTTTAMASVTERTQEIGILRAVGFRRTHVAAVILMETTLVTGLGGLAGWLAGMVAARGLGPSLAQTTSVVAVEPTVGVAAIVGAVLVGVAGGAYPAVRAAQMDPSSALRQF